MLFNSVEYLLFITASFAAYHAVAARFRKHCLLASSVLFYCFWSVPFAGLLAAVTLAAYLSALWIERADREERKQRLLRAALVLFLGLLGYFKYAAAWLGPLWERLSHSGSPALTILVPVGISYYTFKIISYVLDVYWERLPAERDFAALALHVFFFPQILSGPIQRASDFLPQLKALGPVSEATAASGLRLMLFGYFKKVVIADRLAYAVDPVFADPSGFNSLTLLFASYGFMIQLYADFSGLTDIAIGSARLFGFQSPKNFDSPFWAPNIQVYWRKWHMSLTQWLGDYLFTPLRMSFRRYGERGLVAAITLNMIAIGLWHGARWNYLYFGLLHGIFISWSALTLRRRDAFFERHPRLALPRRIWSTFFTFHAVILAAVFFRAETPSKAWGILSGISALRFGADASGFIGKTYIGVACLAFVLAESAHLIQSAGAIERGVLRRPRWVRWALYYVLFFGIFGFGQFSSVDFIYFQF